MKRDKERGQVAGGREDKTEGTRSGACVDGRTLVARLGSSARRAMACLWHAHMQDCAYEKTR